MHKAQTVGVVLPIYNPDQQLLNDVVRAILRQTHPVEKIVILDSSPSSYFSMDWTSHENICLVPVSTEDFDHGGTRNKGVDYISDLDAAVFLTQDAVMAEDCIDSLVRFINDKHISAAFARQIPRAEAGVLESFDRRFNYPDVSRLVSGSPKGIEDVFFSNVCSVVRLDAFFKVGKFPEDILTNEDVALVLKLLDNNFSYGYCSEAVVVHSHAPNFMATLRRFFDTGAMHRMWEDKLSPGSVRGRGIEYLVESVKMILKEDPKEIVVLFLHVASKSICYALGKRFFLMGGWLRKQLSGNRAYWNKRSTRAKQLVS